MNLNTQMVDESLVDMETGEVVDSQGLIDKAVLEDLPRFARSLQGLDARIADIEEYRAGEMKRINEICDFTLGPINKSRGFFTGLAEKLMKGSNKDKLDYPGLGKFRFGQSRESVDDDAYEAGDDFGKEAIAKQYPSLFVTKKTVRPDKKSIMAELKEGREIPGFTLNRKHETFTFKAE